jgi:hypothetical protein
MRVAKWRAIQRSKRKPRTSATSSADSGGKVEVVFEEGTQLAWLYKLLKPLVSSAPVCDQRNNKLINGEKKSDDEDAEARARLPRLGAVKAMYKGGDQHIYTKKLRPS